MKFLSTNTENGNNVAKGTNAKLGYTGILYIKNVLETTWHAIKIPFYDLSIKVVHKIISYLCLKYTAWWII